MPEQILLKKLRGDAKKFAAVFPDGKTVKFGAAGASDYTIHKDPERMARYIKRHGGRPTKETDLKKIHADMLTVTRSKKEDWTAKTGVHKAGFFSRWVLWSEPSLPKAVRQTNRVLASEGKYRLKLR